MPWREVEPELELYHLTREHRICRKYCSESVGKPGGEWWIVLMSRGNIGVYIGASGIAMSAAHSSRSIEESVIPLHVFLMDDRLQCLLQIRCL